MNVYKYTHEIRSAHRELSVQIRPQHEMKANIQAQTDNGIVVRVVDNADIEHRVEIDGTGEIASHQCSAYAGEERARSPRENQHVDQVNRYSKYYVDRKRGLNTLRPYSKTDRITHPERLAAATLIIGAMSPETLKSHFGAYYRQIASAYADVEPPVSPPDREPDADCHRVQQDVYLALNDDQWRLLGDVLVELDGLAALATALDREPNRNDDDLFDRLEAALPGEPDGYEGDAAGDDSENRFLRGLSPLRVHWQAAEGKRVTYGDGSDPGAESAPDARLQMTVQNDRIETVQSFQRHLIHHLRCQVRDCYVGMGFSPPKGVRVRGTGIDALTDKYEHHDGYQRYHDPDAIIDWTRQAPAQHPDW